MAYSVEDAAAQLGIGRTMAYDLIQKGQLPTFTIGRRRLIKHDDLQQFVAERPTTGAS